MSIYKITHSCGHTVEHQIYGTNVHGEREKKAAWLESRLCYDCYKQAEAEKAAKASEDANLPELTGSKKQIAWATDIRAKAAFAINEMRAKIAANTNTSEINLKQIAAVESVLDELCSRSSAKWWIDNRGEDFDVAWIIKQAKGKMQ